MLGSSGSSPDIDLRQRLQANATDVLADQFARYGEPLWRMIHFRLDPMLAGRVDEDDVIQEAWLAALKRVEHFIGNESLSMFAWLRLIVGQTLIDVQRRHLGSKMRDPFRERSINKDAFTNTTSSSLAAALLGTWSSPSEVAIRDESSRQLREAIEQMDPIDREVLAMRHFEELSNREVAELLGIQENTASNRYVRALQRLKIILDALPEFAPHSSASVFAAQNPTNPFPANLQDRKQN